MVCKKCGTEFDGTFCPKCGERAEEKMTVCPVCGKERAEGESFCAKCGYAFEQQASETQKPQAKITFDKEALIGGVKKYYKVALNIGKVFFSLLLLLVLASPIMLHEGINTAGSGYTNAFNLYVDGRFTAVCAILMITAFYTLIYGVYDCVKFFVFRNREESKASKIIYFAASFLVFILCCIGCSGAGEWFADAGAGLSFGIFVGIVGMALSILRLLFEKKLLDGVDDEHMTEVSDEVKEMQKKATKKVGLGTAVVTGALVVAVIITSIVQSVYTNPFSTTSYGFAETRADVIKQFGMPENAKEDSASYTYYSTEYAAAVRMIDALIDAQEKDLSDDFDMDADSFDEDDLESMFDGAAGIDGIIEKLEEKQESEIYKKSTVTFDNDGGDDRNNDTVKSYVCEVVTPAVEGEEKTERTLKKFDLISGKCIEYTKTIDLEYFAKYDDGSFIKDTATLHYQDEMPEKVEFSDILGKYEVETQDIDVVELTSGSAYVDGDTLYVVADVEKRLYGSEDVKKIVIREGVENICDDAFDGYENAVTITVPQSLKSITKYAIDNTAFYKTDSNWENGNALYLGNMLIAAKDVDGRAIVLRESVEKIAKYAFKDCSSGIQWGKNPVISALDNYAFSGYKGTEIVIPDGVTDIGSYAFSGSENLKSLTIPASVTNIGSYAFV